MQPNAITVQETSASVSGHEFADDAAALVSASQPAVREAHAGVSLGEPAATDYALSGLAGAVVSHRLLAGYPYAAQSIGRQAFYDVCKRGLDVTVAAALLALALPLFALLAALVKATSRGPVFFRHRRLGRHGREFACLKFRTMVVDAEEQLRRNDLLRRRFEETFKIRNDPRITPVGSFLRRSSLDELPQLWHVLRGEMSLIGPRPIVPPELEKYSIYGGKLLSVRPGLSGMWQVCGRSDTTYPQRVMMDMHYIDHRSLRLDLWLMLYTVAAVVRKSGAC